MIPIAISALAGAGIAIAISAVLLRGQEKRIQHLEHEVAQLHAGYPHGTPTSQAGFAAPTTPEVQKRYAAMRDAVEHLGHTAALAESMRKDKES